jgi:hypothetical protein
MQMLILHEMAYAAGVSIDDCTFYKDTSDTYIVGFSDLDMSLGSPMLGGSARFERFWSVECVCNVFKETCEYMQGPISYARAVDLMRYELNVSNLRMCVTEQRDREAVQRERDRVKSEAYQRACSEHAEERQRRWDSMTEFEKMQARWLDRDH